MTHFIPESWGPLAKWLLAFSAFTIRYLLFAGVAYLLFYMYKRQDWLFLKIQQKFPERKRVVYEVYHSFMTFVVFAFMVLLLGFLKKHGLTWKYGQLGDRSTAYFVFTSVFVIFFHDAYFYWTHRAMHHPWLFKRMHKVHHMSNDPTPWAAFSFHPSEAVVEFAFVPLLAMMMPIHPLSFAILSMWMIVFNVLGHLGYELFPKGFTNHWFFKWSNTSTHHNMHHKYVKCNYGLYFNIWDRLMGTNHAKYTETFEKVVARREEHRAAQNPTEPETGLEELAQPAVS